MILFNNTPLFTLGGSSPFWVSEAAQSVAAGLDDLLGESVALRGDGELLVGGGFFEGSVLETRGEAYTQYTSKGDVSQALKFPAFSGFPAARAKVDSVTGNQYVLGQSSGLTIYDADFLFLSRTTQAEGDITSQDADAFDLSDAGDAYCINRRGLGTGPRILKVNAGGAIVWRRSLTRADFRPGGISVAVNKSDGVAYLGTNNGNQGIVDSFVPILASYDSSGTLRWQKRFISPTLGGGFAVKPRVSSAGDVYMVCGASGTDANGTAMLKISEAGDIIWQRRLLIGGDANRVSGVAAYHLSADGHLYVAYRELSGSTSLRTIIAKIDTLGDLIWTVSLTKTGSSSVPRVEDMLAIDESLYVAGAFIFTLARISSDGIPLSGGDYVISPVTRTLVAMDYATSNSNLTSATLAPDGVSQPTDVFTDVTSLSSTLIRL